LGFDLIESFIDTLCAGHIHDDGLKASWRASTSVSNNDVMACGGKRVRNC
jgi:hypothetical protein